MVMSQVLAESWNRLPSEGPWLHTGKNSKLSHRKVKGLFTVIHTPWTKCSLSQKGEWP